MEATREWLVDGPRVIDVGDDGEVVRRLRVSVVGGRVDVVGHDSPTARIEVSAVEEVPLRIAWDGSELRISQLPDRDGGILGLLTQRLAGIDRAAAVLSVSVPTGTRTSVGTVTASALVTGVTAPVRVKTVSGPLALDTITGDVDANTVSGDVECADVTGQLVVRTVSGSLTARACTLAAVRIDTVSGDVTLDLRNSAATIASSSVSGDVTVRAPRGGYDVEMRTPSGHVVVDGTELGRGPQCLGGGRIVDGDGALKVRARSASGNLVVLRAPAPSPDGTGTTGAARTEER